MTDDHPAPLPTDGPAWDVTPDTCPQRRAGIATVAVDDELVVAHPESFGVIHFDPVTTILWRSFGPGVSIAELAEDVADVLGMDRAEAEGKLSDVVRSLGRTGFLTEPADPPMRRIPRFPTVAPDT